MEVDAKLIDHLMNPRNYGTLQGCDAHGVGLNPQNGEKVTVYLRIGFDDTIPFIDDIRFEAIGCTTTIVAGSMLTEEAKGLSLKGAKNLVAASMQLLDRLPPEEAACSEMVALAIQAAVETYENSRNDPNALPVAYTIKQSCEPKDDA